MLLIWTIEPTKPQFWRKVAQWGTKAYVDKSCCADRLDCVDVGYGSVFSYISQDCVAIVKISVDPNLEAQVCWQ